MAIERPATGTGETAQSLTEDRTLKRTPRYGTREKLDPANRALRASEEQPSKSGEYSSVPPRGETGIEELQSINAALQSLNSELRLKLEALSRAHSDLQNLVAAADMGTLFLDSNLHIKLFTEQVSILFRISRNDEGRPITDFAHLLDYDDLVADAKNVMAKLAPIRREVRARSGRWYDFRLRPYRAAEDKIDGIVITIVDITERRQTEEALRASGQLLRQEKSLVDLARDPIFIWDFDGGIVSWNRGSEELYGFTREEALGKRKEHLLATRVEGSSFGEVREKLLRDGFWRGELKHRTKDNRELAIESRIILEKVGGRRLALESTRDITERKLWDQRQQLLLGELSHRVKNTLTVVQSIAQQTLHRGNSPKEMVERLEGRLMALARAHALLVESNWKGADFHAIAKQQLDPYGAENAKRLRLEGPPATLPSDLATPFGLVLHELATNAAKYGSLSKPTGSVSLRWKLAKRNDRPVLTVVWTEKGGPPPPKKPKAAGFGTSLIDRGIPNAKVGRDLKTEGLVCTIELPLPQSRNGEPGAKS
jgi:two-component system CheB/CheR fusion protein